MALQLHLGLGVCLVLAGTGLAMASPDEVEPWTQVGISSPQFESHPAFDPRNGDLYFVRSSPEFRGWHLLRTRCGKQGWSDPQPPTFAGDGQEADPWFTPDGAHLYFISSRTDDGIKRKDLDIWRIDRSADGRWGKPQRLPEPVNSSGAEWFPRLSADGWLYFGSSRSGGFGRNDIWRARQKPAGEWQVENLGPALNTAGDEYEPLPSSDGSRMILMAEGGLYRSRKTSIGWTPREKLGPGINVNGSEIGAVFSPSGKSLLFARDLKGDLAGEFFVWHIEGHEAWPPRCPEQRK